MSRPTTAQARQFGQYIKQWQRKLNLGDWRVVKGRGASMDETMADVVISYPDKLATYRLGDFGDKPIDQRDLESTAVHELLHVLLADLIEVVRDPRSDENHRLAAEHRVVNTLESILVPEND